MLSNRALLLPLWADIGVKYLEYSHEKAVHKSDYKNFSKINSLNTFRMTPAYIDSMQCYFMLYYDYVFPHRTGRYTLSGLLICFCSEVS